MTTPVASVHEAININVSISIVKLVNLVTTLLFYITFSIMRTHSHELLC